MKTKQLILTIALLALSSAMAFATPLGTAFTYQGRLADGGNPANGSYDLWFLLYSAPSGPGLVAGPLTNSATAVTNGSFTVALDFGASAFDGNARWLLIGVRTNGGETFTLLSPRQPLTPTPYALYAPSAGTAATAGSAGSVAASNITGTMALAQLPGSVLTNGASGINLSGTFSGNGAGLTNLPAGAVATPPPGMVLIPAGSFTIGDTLDGMGNAVPVTATISAFYLDVNEVSWSQWQSVYYWATNRGYGFVNAGSGKAANHPVQTVRWYDCVKWCNARSQQAQRTPVYYTDAGLTQVYTNGEPTTLYPNWAAKGYRLPTEAEWEKAARGGLSGQRFPWGNVINQNLANYYGATASYSYDLGPNGYHPLGNYPTTSPGTSPVGSFAANGYGLNDMAGNVIEWCWDWYGIPYAGGSDPRGPASGSLRVLRGGGWINDAYSCRTAFRNGYYPAGNLDYLGFRSVLPSGQ